VLTERNSKIYYAIGDIHGQKDLLNEALKYIYNKNGDKIIFLGDYIDRGPDSLGVLNIVMNPPEDKVFICLQGNHEDMFHHDEWYCNIFKSQLKGKFDRDIQHWMRKLPLAYIVGENVFAHAWFDPTLSIDRQVSHFSLWNRFYSHEDYTGPLFLVHGHTPKSNGPEQLKNRIDLDIGAMYGDKICVGIFKEGIRGPIGYAIIYKNGKVEENIFL
jgi:serine/threonine protein phosphatase 1